MFKESHSLCNGSCGHGTCVRRIDRFGVMHYTCHCDPDWHGDHCTLQIGDWGSTPVKLPDTTVTTALPTKTLTTFKTHSVVVISGNSCGPYLCLQGSCTYQQFNGIEVSHTCTCNTGWIGEACDMFKAHDYQCHNPCGHGTCVGQRDLQGRTNYKCLCDPGWDGEHCTYVHGEKGHDTTTTTVTTTSTTTTAATTTVKMTTTTPVLTFPNCDRSDVLTSIALQTSADDQNALDCSAGSHTSHDALVLSYCTVPQDPSSWKRGVNVMSYCSGQKSLPGYTPIAAFESGIYSPKGSLSGVFVSCTDKGFKVAFQTCDHSPEFKEITIGGSYTENPYMWYTIS